MSVLWCYRSSKLRRIIVDPGLYLTEKSAMFYVTQKRDLPNAFRLFSGVSFFVSLFLDKLYITFGSCILFW